MADTCPKCGEYKDENVHNLSTCADCVFKRNEAIKGASEGDIERLRDKELGRRARNQS